MQYTGFTVKWNETLVGATVEVSCTGPGLDGSFICVVISNCLSFYMVHNKNLITSASFDHDNSQELHVICCSTI